MPAPLSASSEVASFVATARVYCDLIADAERWTQGELLAAAQRRMIALYAATLELPVVEPRGGRGREPRITHDEWAAACARLRAVLGSCDLYREIYDPAALGDPAGAIEGGDEPVVASLADDLADIWRDLRPGLDRWEAASESRRSHIVWVWQFGFASHWGQHLVDGLRAIHWWRHVHFVGEVGSDGPEA